MKPRRISNAPELNVFLFAVLLNLPWEFLQTPFFEGIAAAPHWEAVKTCTVASLADGAIALAAYAAVAVAAQSRSWVLRPRPRQVIGFVAVGLAITVAGEHLATGPLKMWAYAKGVPTILGVGLPPLLQWTLLPPLILWFVRRQLT